MSLSYPDAKRGVREVLDAYGATYLQLTITYADTLPAYLIYRVGGSESAPFREDRITVETRADGTTAADDAAKVAHEALVGIPHDTSHGLLDSVTVESLPTEIPQPDGSPNLVTATYRVQTRGLPA